MVNRLLFSLPLTLVLTCGCHETPTVPQKTVNQYEQYCSACHESGAANAPKRGDGNAWTKRLRKGNAVLLKSMKDGPVSMPPKGGCVSCSDEELLLLVKYLSAPQD